MIEHCVSRNTDCCKARSGIRCGEHSHADGAKDLSRLGGSEFSEVSFLERDQSAREL